KLKIGVILLKQKKIESAIQKLQAVIHAEPDNAYAKYYLGVAYEELGNNKKAIEILEQIPPDSLLWEESRLRLSLIYKKTKKMDKAYQVLKDAILIKPEDPMLYVYLGSLYEESGKYEEAEKYLREGLKIQPTNIDLMFRLGVLLDKKKEKEKALNIMREILKQDPRHADALNYIGYSYAELGIKLDEAKTLIERALKEKPRNGYILDSLAWVYYKMGKYEEALKKIKQALKYTPNDPIINEHLGDIYRALKRWKRALNAYKNVLNKLNPENPEKIRAKIKEVEEHIKAR
ncbi:MAG: hypothetical protein DRG83_16925, partial [Deltaproteobacteria bacterium]